MDPQSRLVPAHRWVRGGVLVAAVATLIAVVPAQPAAAAPVYTMVDLGKRGRSAQAVGINAWSEVIGSYFDATLGASFGFFVSPARTGGALVDLPNLPCTACSPSTFPLAINDLGVIAGTSAADDGEHTVLWIGDAVIDLGVTGATLSPTAMNNRGEIVGTGHDAAGQRHAFAWNAVTGSRDISAGYPYAAANDINDRGQIVGDCGAAGVTDTRACLWQPDGTVTLLSGLPTDRVSTAMAINNHGVVVGRYSDPVTGRSIAYRWEAGVVTPLSAGSSYAAQAWDINDAGVVVGHYYLPSAQGPWVWRDGQLIDLPASSSGPRQGPGLAVAVNRFGVIAGRSGTATDPWFHAVLWRG